MATARKRGGAKAHRKKVQQRNQQISAEKSALQKIMDESLRRQIEELKKKYDSESGTTQNS